VQKIAQEKKTLIIIAQRVNNQNMYVRVISKVRKIQNHNPEFGHTQGEVQKKHCKKYISIQWGMKLRIPSILVIN
jgi:ribosomal protein S17